MFEVHKVCIVLIYEEFPQTNKSTNLNKKNNKRAKNSN